MKTVLIVIGIIISLASVALVGYFGIYVMFIGGIIQLVDALKQTDIPSMDVGMGAFRVLIAGASTTVAGFIAFFLNACLWAGILSKR